MNKVKRMVCIVLSGIFIVGGIAIIIRSNFKIEPPQEEKQVYTITYRAIENGEEKSIYWRMWQDGGSYPTTYTAGEEVFIDDLFGGMGDFVPVPEEWGMEGAGFYTGNPVMDAENPNKDYTFKGWYLDKACTQPFDGVITARAHEDITLYAKISVGYWTPSY